ncbi:hypothetical protein FB446DRAFT_805573 [Lentinula raphanica]|nr:hypothetical protein FB446DRAFT_805573 [Lentinula raphanica]
MLRVPAMDQPPDSGGTRAVGLSDSVTSTTIVIFFGEHYSKQGVHTVLLRFLGREDFPPLPANVDVQELSWSRIGSAHFHFGEHVVDEAFGQAKELAGNGYQPHLPFSDDMKQWWYLYNIMWLLHEYHSISSETMKGWEGKLPESFKTRTLTKGTDQRYPAEQVHLWLDNLLISPSQESFVPRTGSVPNPTSRSAGSKDFPIGKSSNNINIDQVRAYIKACSTSGFHGEDEDVEKWKNSVAKWEKMDAEALERYKKATGRAKEPRTFSVALQFWKNIDDWMYALYALGAISKAELDVWVQLRSEMVTKLVMTIENKVKQRAWKSSH